MLYYDASKTRLITQGLENGPILIPTLALMQAGVEIHMIEDQDFQEKLEHKFGTDLMERFADCCSRMPADQYISQMNKVLETEPQCHYRIVGVDDEYDSNGVLFKEDADTTDWMLYYIIEN